MIDIKDLMIGNYVEYCEGIYKVVFLDREHSSMTLEKEDLRYIVKKEYINTVPITAEWLEKDLNLYRNERSIHYVLPLPTNKHKSMTTYWSGTRWVLEIAFMEVAAVSYRHELQNFFRILTGKDLI